MLQNVQTEKLWAYFSSRNEKVIFGGLHFELITEHAVLPEYTQYYVETQNGKPERYIQLL